MGGKNSEGGGVKSYRERQNPIEKYNQKPRVYPNVFVLQRTTINYIESNNAIDKH
jgi:hypothetical protein